MTRSSALVAIPVAIGLACVACAADHDKPAGKAVAGASVGCLAAGGGYLQAQLRGAVVADLNWTNAEMQCEGSPRPGGQGLRLTFAGSLPATPPGSAGATRPGAGGPHQLRLIFGIDPQDIAAGAAQALPTNLTVILEGEKQLYATRGTGLCAVESLERTPLGDAGGKSRKSRVHARGYCVGPATSLAGDARLLIPTFEFTGVADTEIAP